MLKASKPQEPEIAHGVQVSVEKLQEYLAKTRRTKVYAIAMSTLSNLSSSDWRGSSAVLLVVNPTIKLKWLEEHWEESEVSAAKEWMINSVSKA
jgi:hypothetical protein